jgi:hypothetical protein
MLSDFGMRTYHCMVDSDKPEGHPIARVFEAMAAGMAVLVEDRLVSRVTRPMFFNFTLSIPTSS